VRLTRCSPSALELEIPESHVRHAARGKLVVGSRFVHGCAHLPQSPLYHRVLAVRRREPWPSTGRPMHRVELATEALPSFAHAVRFLSFHFGYMPPEARDVVKYPEMRTDFGTNREYLQRKRRLMTSPFKLLGGLKALKKLKGMDTDDGGFVHGGKSGGSISTQNGILNFKPKQVSNFGWNWNFFMNTTEEPNFFKTLPGAKGFIKVRKPYIKVHAGIYLNFTSEFGGMLKAPKVNWQFGLRGHGYVQARVLANLNTTASAGVNILKAFNLSMLQQLARPQWFEKIEFATGKMPISFEPGFQFKAKAYHEGTFHGAVAFGVKTHGIVSPMLSFDSLKGFDVHCNGTLLDTEVIPPMWMIFTKRFELGIMLMPSLLMRGDFAGLEKATLAIEMRPYMNLTVTRSGETSSVSAATEKALTVYPIRVMGLAESQSQRKYKVKIEALGQDLETSPEMNWGQVQFHGRVSAFNAGEVSQNSVTEEPIQVSLIEVDDSTTVPTERLLGSGAVQCTSMLNGACHPSPPIVNVKQGTAEIAAVELAVIWQDSPEPWFASKIRGVSISFPEVVLRQDALADSFPAAVAAAAQSNQSQPLSMHLVQGGQSYTVPISGDATSSTQDTLHGEAAIEFGPAFIETWLPCDFSVSAKCESPRLELYYGQTQVAVANLPQIEWTSETAMQGTGESSFMGSSSSSNAMNVPSTVAMYSPDSQTTSIAVATMNAKVMPPASSSLFFQPSPGSQMPLNSLQPFVWTVSGLDREQAYSFTVNMLRLTTVAPTAMPHYANYRKIGTAVLVPIPGQKQKLAEMKCSSMAVAGMSAAEAPCSFTYNLTVGSGFNVGDLVVTSVEWSEDGLLHEMFSPPVMVAARAASRRLREQNEFPQPSERRLTFKSKWDSRVNQHAKNCQAKNLHFNLGAGMLVRGRVDNVGVPKGFPMLGGLDEEPELTTGFKRVAAIKPGTDAADLLPSAFCKGGLCSGALPGCTEANFKKMVFKKLVFNHNRAFHYKKKTKGKLQAVIKQAFAYAFSTLPEAVDITIRELNDTDSEPPPEEPKKQRSTAAPHGWLRESTTPAPAVSTPETPPPLPATSGGGSPGSNGAAFNRWWSGAARRLLEQPAPAPAPGRLLQQEGGQVTVRFREDLRFEVNRSVVQMMLDNGYFMEVEDDATKELGPLHITSFYLEEEPGALAGTEPGTASAPHGLPRRLLQSAAVLPVALMGALVASALAAKRRGRGGIQVASASPVHRRCAAYAAWQPQPEELQGME